MWWERLKKEVLDTDLYTRSGTEVGVSEGHLKLVENAGDYDTVKVGVEDIPEIAYRASTDRGADYQSLNKQVFGKLPESWLVGNYEKIYVGHSTDPELRRNGSSGGVISAIQLYLLQKQKIEGAITLRMRHDKPFLTEPIIAKNRKEIMEGAQSKYTIAPVNQVLSDLPGQFQSLSYTGLPEHIASIRILESGNHPSVKPIKYILGFFYGEALGFGAIRSLLKANGVKDVNEIETLRFREGEWPGNLYIKLKSGKEIRIPKFYANYLSPSHITEYSLYQVDYMAELADIASGDAWAPVYEERGQGWSVVIARTKKGLELIDEMRREGALELNEITPAELINMHSLGLDVKKRGGFIRIARRRKQGLPVPEYGYEAYDFPLKRRLFESFSMAIIRIFHWPIVLWSLEQIPTKVIGEAFVYARKIWKKSTKSTKKSGLEHLKFRITHAK